MFFFSVDLSLYNDESQLKKRKRKSTSNDENNDEEGNLARPFCSMKIFVYSKELYQLEVWLN